jgi:signal transduction histidine kinase
VFFGTLFVGRRVGAPIEIARQRQLEFTADASHELRTPLAVIEAQTRLALSEARDRGRERDSLHHRVFSTISWILAIVAGRFSVQAASS